eukprot:1162009-Pelagomonas_calceolata.AAC.7
MSRVGDAWDGVGMSKVRDPWEPNKGGSRNTSNSSTMSSLCWLTGGKRKHKRQLQHGCPLHTVGCRQQGSSSQKRHGCAPPHSSSSAHSVVCYDMHLLHLLPA